MSSSEEEKAKRWFVDLVRSIDSEIEVVIPVAASSDLYLIALNKRKGKKFMQISEDDMLDLASEESVREEIEEKIREAVSELQAQL
jgi:hypothetical protein